VPQISFHDKSLFEDVWHNQKVTSHHATGTKQMLMVCFLLLNSSTDSPPPQTARDLVSYNRAQLEQLFRQAPAMDSFPAGDWRGKVLPAPGSRSNSWKSTVLGMGWIGKRFIVDRGIMINRLPVGTAIRARMAIRPSSLDGRDCLYLDYAGVQGPLTRWVEPIHDEVREIAPGLLLGYMQNSQKPCDPTLWFVLEKPAKACRNTK
jgi:hypothetical protein